MWARGRPAVRGPEQFRDMTPISPVSSGVAIASVSNQFVLLPAAFGCESLGQDFAGGSSFAVRCLDDFLHK